MLHVENLGKRFGSRWIFRGLNFEVEQGQRLAVLGSNGSGKSTLLRALCGLDRPSEGKVGLPEGDSRTVLGYAGLEMALYGDLSIEEHLSLTASLRGCPARTDELLDLVGLKHARKVPSLQLSTGMKARLKLCMAIQPFPKLLFLDEPSASLDGDGRRLIEEVCERQSTTGCVIFATNDPLERRMATHELALG